MGARDSLEYDGAGSLTRAIELPAEAAGDVAPVNHRLCTARRCGFARGVRPPLAVARAGPLRVRLGRQPDSQRRRQRPAPRPTSRDRSARRRAPFGPDGAVTNFTYDTSNGTVSRVVVDADGAAPVIEVLQSDEAGRPLYSQGPLGEETTFTWWDNRLQERQRHRRRPDREPQLTYDGNGQVLTDSDGRRTVSYAYDLTGGVRRTSASALDGSAADTSTCTGAAPTDACSRRCCRRAFAR